MKNLVRVLSLALLPVFAGSTVAQPAQGTLAPSSDLKIQIEILSDTGGADMAPFMKALVDVLKSRWASNAGASDASRGPFHQTVLDLSIAPDGKLTELKLDGMARGDALDKAAWTAARDTTYIPLPSGVAGNLHLRLHLSAD